MIWRCCISVLGTRSWSIVGNQKRQRSGKYIEIKIDRQKSCRGRALKVEVTYLCMWLMLAMIKMSTGPNIDPTRLGALYDDQPSYVKALRPFRRVVVGINVTNKRFSTYLSYFEIFLQNLCEFLIASPCEVLILRMVSVSR